MGDRGPLYCADMFGSLEGRFTTRYSDYDAFRSTRRNDLAVRQELPVRGSG